MDHGFTAEDLETVRKVRAHVAERTMIQVDRQMGLDKDHSFHCRLYISPHMARVALMWGKSLFVPTDLEAAAQATPDFVTVYVPEWPERKVLADVDAQVNFVLGVDYYGEAKKSFLRQAMYAAKKDWGGIGLHAGSKLLRVVDDYTGVRAERGAIFFGLSGTGKTSLTCHHHDLEGKESVEILQDDVVLMDSEGACYGTEDGFFIKTDGLDPEDQALLYESAISENAVFENVWVGPDHEVDFDNDALTGNGRAIVLRTEVGMTSDRVDLAKADLIFFITRNNTMVPPVARLTPEQAAAAFMLGESIKTSAADPAAKGEPVRCVGTNPFIVGDLAQEGNRFYEILQRSDGQLQCFLLNTGRAGGKAGEKIKLRDSQSIIREIARGSVRWRQDRDWGYEVAAHVPGIEIERFDPTRFYSSEELTTLTSELKADRQAWLDSFEGLNPDIRDVFKA